MTLQLRVNLPDEFGEHDLTEDGREIMELFQALLARYGMTNYQIVRLDKTH